MKTMIHTHYDNLRITRNATQGIIKAAYRALSVEYHPDKNPDRDTTRIMQIINDAYEVLSDPVAREKYDAKVAAEESSAASRRDSERQPPAAEAPSGQRAAPADTTQTQARPAKPRPTMAVYLLFGTLVVLLFVLIVLAFTLS